MRLPLLIVDTETTGLLEDWARIVEIAAVAVNSEGRAVGAFTSMVRPDLLDHRADAGLAINHITRDVIEAAPSTAEVAEALHAWLRRLNLPGIKTTAYNAPFDRTHCARAGFQLPPWDTCIMQAARKHFDVKSLKLRDAAERCGIPPFLPAHRALSDAQTAAAVAVEILMGARPKTQATAPVALPPGAAPAVQAPALTLVPDAIRFFGGHHRFLSNAFPTPVGIYDTVFPSVEHAYQAMKGPQSTWGAFLVGAPEDATRLGESLPERLDWPQVQVPFMQALVYDKFHRTPEIGHKLKYTGTAELLYGNMVHDNFWGACACAQCAPAEKRNELGRILMVVREALYTESPF